MLFRSLKECSFWFHWFLLHSDTVKTLVLALSLYMTCMQQREKILTINVLSPCLLLFKQN